MLKRGKETEVKGGGKGKPEQGTEKREIITTPFLKKTSNKENPFFLAIR